MIRCFAANREHTSESHHCRYCSAFQRGQTPSTKHVCRCAEAFTIDFVWRIPATTRERRLQAWTTCYEVVDVRMTSWIYMTANNSLHRWLSLGIGVGWGWGTQGRIQDFHGRGGGGRHKRLNVPTCTLRARNRTHFRQGSRTRSKGYLEDLRVDLILSCYLSLILKHSDKNVGLKNIVDPILGGGGGACCAPLDPPLGTPIVAFMLPQSVTVLKNIA